MSNEGRRRTALGARRTALGLNCFIKQQGPWAPGLSARVVRAVSASQQQAAPPHDGAGRLAPSSEILCVQCSLAGDAYCSVFALPHIVHRQCTASEALSEVLGRAAVRRVQVVLPVRVRLRVVELHDLPAVLFRRISLVLQPGVQ
jgi:hypothetical protein